MWTGRWNGYSHSARIGHYFLDPAELPQLGPMRTYVDVQTGQEGCKNKEVKTRKQGFRLSVSNLSLRPTLKLFSTHNKTFAFRRNRKWFSTSDVWQCTTRGHLNSSNHYTWITVITFIRSRVTAHYLNLFAWQCDNCICHECAIKVPRFLHPQFS